MKPKRGRSQGSLGAAFCLILITTSSVERVCQRLTDDTFKSVSMWMMCFHQCGSAQLSRTEKRVGSAGNHFPGASGRTTAAVDTVTIFLEDLYWFGNAAKLWTCFFSLTW